MKRKIFLATIIVILLITGCGKTAPADTNSQLREQSEESPSVEIDDNHAPYNLKDVKGFSPIENQSFMVDLNSWGKVKFVSGKLTGGNHIPVVFYLTDKDGDILYDFQATLPYMVDVKAVSFEDVSKDGLKDIIIIVDDAYPGQGNNPQATVYFQKSDGSFANDLLLDQEINDSKSNRDVKTVKSYLDGKI